MPFVRPVLGPNCLQRFSAGVLSGLFWVQTVYKVYHVLSGLFWVQTVYKVYQQAFCQACSGSKLLTKFISRCLSGLFWVQTVYKVYQQAFCQACSGSKLFTKFISRCFVRPVLGPNCLQSSSAGKEIKNKTVVCAILPITDWNAIKVIIFHCFVGIDALRFHNCFILDIQVKSSSDNLTKITGKNLIRHFTVQTQILVQSDQGQHHFTLSPFYIVTFCIQNLQKCGISQRYLLKIQR